MPHIDSTAFGEIVVDGRKYFQVLIVDGEVKERESDRLKADFGTFHRIADWEAGELLPEGGPVPEAMVIGTGRDGLLRVDEGFLEKCREKGVEVVAEKTPEAVETYNRIAESEVRVNALFHTTC